MKPTIRKLLVLVASLGLAAAASALPITPTSGDLNTTRWEGDQNSTPAILTAISPIIGSATELYKSNVGGPEEGPLAGSYDTTFTDTPSDPSGASILYVGGPIVSPTAFLLVKDGNQSPAWYLFNLTALGWNGTDTLDLSGFWPNQGAISHVSLFGTRTSVPDEGATLGLLGIGLVGIALLRRRLAA
jgi:hypothetical protein